jgi:hypothetical protein
MSLLQFFVFLIIGKGLALNVILGVYFILRVKNRNKKNPLKLISPPGSGRILLKPGKPGFLLHL